MNRTIPHNTDAIWRPDVTVACVVPRGPIWARMSDHLPLVTDFSLSKQ